MQWLDYSIQFNIVKFSIPPHPGRAILAWDSARRFALYFAQTPPTQKHNNGIKIR